MTAHARDKWLNVRRESSNVIRKDLTMFLALSPVRSICI